MPARSTLARLQQFTTGSVVVAALAWLVALRDHSPGWAVTGFVAILMGHAFVLAAEFVALYLVKPEGGTPRPTAAQLVKAWIGESLTAPRVFCWRQPFRWRAVPDHLEGAGLAGRRGVVFVHGLVCNRGFWTPWLVQARARGHAFVAVNLEPVFGSIDDYAPTIEAAVCRVTQATGLPPVLVCHSLGGLAARAWLRRYQSDHRVAHVVTIASPHHGAWLARFSHLANGRQARIGGEWLTRLNEGPRLPRPVPFTCWYTNCDNIVFPAATATLPGADNRLVPGVAHVDLAFEPEVMEATFALLRS